MRRLLPLLAGALALALPLEAIGADPASPPSCLVPLAPAPASGPLPCPSAPDVACCQESPSGLMGGGAFYYLKPYLQNNTAFVTTLAPGTPTSQVIENTFHWSYDPAAAFWLGWMTPSGLGARARYFFFDQSSSTSNVSNTTTAPPQTTINPPLSNFLPLSTGGTAFGSPGTVLNSGFGTDLLSFGSNLQIHALDIEATYGWQGASWSVLVSGGGRYMTLDQGYHATLTNNPPGIPLTEVQALDSTRNFTGGGPVASVFGQARLGQTGFSLVGSCRGSLLVGSTSEHTNFTQVVNDPTGLVPPGIPGTLQITPQATRTSDTVLTVVELELGAQYDLKMGNSNLFVRASAVSQTYFDAGNASQANGNFGLFGVQLAAGVNY